MKSLLSKSLTLFACCTIICFTLTTPLFYLLTKYYYAEDIIDVIEAVNQGQSIPPLDLEQDIIAGMMIQFLLTFSVISIALFITMRFTTKRLWQPFDDTLKKVEQFNLAKSDIPKFIDTNIREFTSLNRSLEQLMRKDKETYRIQKEFTENASHELQTPIAIIRSKLDLLMQENLNEKEMNIVSDLYNMTKRMEHLNRNLLLLAKIENKQYTSLQNIDIAVVVAESLPLYETLQNDATLQLIDQRTYKSIKTQANPILLECLLKNLIVNAIRHSMSGGEILIEINNNGLAVSNAAADNKSLDDKNLFNRFHSENNRQKGNGLGLAIVKAICDFHHWNVKYDFKEGRHIFTVTIKDH